MVKNKKSAEQPVAEVAGKFIKITDAVPMEVETPCLICEEGVPTPFGYAPKICEKCRAAVMKVRERDDR